jgi:hypothetical protein
MGWWHHDGADKTASDLGNRVDAAVQSMQYEVERITNLLSDLAGIAKDLQARGDDPNELEGKNWHEALDTAESAFNNLWQTAHDLRHVHSMLDRLWPIGHHAISTTANPVDTKEDRICRGRKTTRRPMRRRPSLATCRS